MKLLTKLKIKDIPDDLYAKLYRLNFRSDGEMQRNLKSARDGYGKAYAYVLLDDNETVVSWALVNFPGSSEREVNFYTRANKRRKGYGTVLAEAIKKDYGRKLLHFPHDKASDNFYVAIDLHGEYCESLLGGAARMRFDDDDE